MRSATRRVRGLSRWGMSLVPVEGQSTWMW
jgi:hypothetical protein